MALTLPHRIDTEDPDATTALAERFAALLRPGDTLLLEGAIGAGKTHFARALIRAAQAPNPEDVPSPTFTLVQTYATRRGEIWHADLYRLSEMQEVIELGLEEAFESAICLVEWPDRMGTLAPADALTLRFAVRGDTARTITLGGPRIWASRLARLAEPLGAGA